MRKFATKRSEKQCFARSFGISLHSVEDFTLTTNTDKYQVCGVWVCRRLAKWARSDKLHFLFTPSFKVYRKGRKTTPRFHLNFSTKFVLHFILICVLFFQFSLQISVRHFIVEFLLCFATL